eukprot:9489547-Pyramimonas_sp.AAC.1
MRLLRGKGRCRLLPRPILSAKKLHYSSRRYPIQSQSQGHLLSPQFAGEDISGHLRGGYEVDASRRTGRCTCGKVMMPLRSLIFFTPSSGSAAQHCTGIWTPHRQPSDGGRRGPRPFALAQTGRTF